LDDCALISVKVEHLLWSSHHNCGDNTDSEENDATFLTVDDVAIDLETYDGTMMYGSGDSRLIEVIKVESGDGNPIQLLESEEETICFRVFPRDLEAAQEDVGTAFSSEAIMRAIRASVPIATVSFSIGGVCSRVLRSCAGKAKYTFQQDLEITFSAPDCIQKDEKFTAELSVEVAKGSEHVVSHLDLYLVCIHAKESIPSASSFDSELGTFKEWEVTKEDAEFGTKPAVIPNTQGVLPLERVKRIGVIHPSEKARLTVDLLPLREGLQQVSGLYFFDSVTSSFFEMPEAPVIKIT